MALNERLTANRGPWPPTPVTFSNWLARSNDAGRGRRVRIRCGPPLIAIAHSDRDPGDKVSPATPQKTGIPYGGICSVALLDCDVSSGNCRGCPGPGCRWQSEPDVGHSHQPLRRSVLSRGCAGALATGQKMDSADFDRFTKGFATNTTRRHAMRALGSVGLACALFAMRRQPAAADCPDIKVCCVDDLCIKMFEIPVGPYGACWNWEALACTPCQSTWAQLNELCNKAMPEQCNGRCYANFPLV